MGRATECMEICRQKWGTARIARALTGAERTYRVFLKSTDMEKGGRRNKKQNKLRNEE
jgi:hypothetical protein